MSQSATVVPEKSRQRKANPDKPKPLPPYAVIVENDEVHSFHYVIETFQKVFGYSEQRAFRMAEAIHNHGEQVVWSGSKEVAELKRQQILTAGPDFYVTPTVTFPLGVRIEAMR